MYRYGIQSLETCLKIMLSSQRTGPAGTGEEVLALQYFLPLVCTHASKVRTWKKTVVPTDCRYRIFI
jgi:hypothetical protein